MFKRFDDFRFARRLSTLNRAAQILLSLTLVGALNYLAARHFERWDLTSGGRFTLSAETLAWLDKLPREPGRPLELVLLTPDNQREEDLRVRLEENRALLREFAYAARSLPHGPLEVKFEEVNLTVQSARGTELLNRGLTADTVMMVGLGDRQHFLTLMDLYETFDADNVAFKGENAVTSAILNLLQPKEEVVYFTQGHGELSIENKAMRDGLSKVVDALKLVNFKAKNLDLLRDGDVPEGARLVVIANPRLAQFQPEEVAKLRRFINQKNGRLLILLEPHTRHGLDDLMREWGVRSPDLVVMDLMREANSPEGNLLVLGYTDHELSRSLIKYNLLAKFGYTRAVMDDLTANVDENRKIRGLLTTSPQGVAKADPQSKGLSPYDLGVQRIPLALIVEQQNPGALGVPGGKLMLIGNSDFITNQLVDFPGNLQLFLNSVRYLTDHKEMLNIAPKPRLKLKLGISEGEFKGLMWRLSILPSLFLLLGIAVYFIRHR